LTHYRTEDSNSIYRTTVYSVFRKLLHSVFNSARCPHKVKHRVYLQSRVLLARGARWFWFVASGWIRGALAVVDNDERWSKGNNKQGDTLAVARL
jgi:hypothetical protein